jgi:outer membrane autotransporter protein
MKSSFFRQVFFSYVLFLACFQVYAQCSNVAADGTVGGSAPLTTTCTGNFTGRLGASGTPPSGFTSGAPTQDNVTVNTGNGNTISLDSATFGTNTATILLKDNARINVGTNSTVTSPSSGAGINNEAIFVNNGAIINIGAGATVINYATGGSGPPTINAGNNTIEMGSNNNLTIEAGAKVYAAGTSKSSEAINPTGSGNTITNYGTIQSKTGSALWFQTATPTGAPNIVNNYGSIISEQANQTVFGGNGSVNFTNQTGASVVGNVAFSNGVNTVTLYTGSTITGFINGGPSGQNTFNLEGNGGSTLVKQIINFSTLNKNGTGFWTIDNPLPTKITMNVNQGTLQLNGDNTAYTGTAVINPGATLQGAAAGVVGSTGNGKLTNNGTISFIDSAAGTYSAPIVGSGAVAMNGSGSITLSGANTYSGGTAINAGTLVATNNSSIGSGALAINNGATLQAAAPVSFANSVVLTGQGNIDTNGNSIGLSGPISGSGGFNKVGAGALTLSNTNTYTGDTNINAGSVILTGSTNSNTNIAAGGMLQGSGVINGSLTNTGVVAPSFNGTQTNLTVNGNYVGNSGKFVGGVYAPVSSPIADTLTVNGNTSGSTGITVTDKGGLGNRTAGNGIAVIVVNGTSTSNAFALNQRVASGVYEYKLYKGDSSGAGNSWYLRTDNPGQTSTSSPSSPAPVITPAPGERIEVAVYPAVPSLVQLYAQAAVDTLDQRRGDLNLVDPQGGAKKSSNDWARIIGKTGTSTPSNVSDGPKMNFNAYALQFGVDLYQNEVQEGSRSYVGPYVTIGSANANTSSQTGGISTGSINGMQAYSLGLYGTHFAANGLYVDALAQGTRYLNAGASSVQGAQLRTQGSGFTGSLEGGGRWNFDKFLISPQAQIVYDAIGMNNATDAYGQVNFNKSEMTRGRLGLLAGHKDVVGSTPIFAYLRASYWSIFNAGTSTTMASLYGVNPITFQSQANSRWMTVDAELNARITKDTNLFLNLAVDNSLVGTYQAYSGRIGLQTRF